MPTELSLVSYSHGPDSRYLLQLLLTRYRPSQLILVYFNHGLREESVSEASEVRALGQVLGVRVCIKKLPIQAYQAKFKVSFESAGHYLRKSMLIHLAGIFRATKIYLGHHLDDDIETMVFKLFRGTGSNWHPFLPETTAYGLCWCRPLLGVSKSEILEFLHQHDISYALDQSNTDETYTRNWIRGSFLPQATVINPEYRQALRRFLDIKRTEASDIAQDMQALLSPHLVRGRGFVEIDRKVLVNLPSSLLTHAVFWMLHQAFGHLFSSHRILGPRWSISALHIQALLDGIKSGRSGRCSLPKDAIAEWTQTGVGIYLPTALPSSYQCSLSLDSPLVIEDLGISILLCRDARPCVSLPCISTIDSVTLCLPSDTTVLTVRPYHRGDDYRMRGALAPRCVWHTLKNRHILPFKRAILPLFFYRHHLLWAPGLVPVDERIFNESNTPHLSSFTISIQVIS